MTTKGVSFESPSFSLAVSRLIEKSSSRMGLPVRVIVALPLNLERASSKLMATWSTYFERILFVTPGKAFCSWITVGIFFMAAVKTTGPQTYPPVPITASGLNSLNILFVEPKLLNSLVIVFKVSRDSFLLNPFTSIN